MSATQLDARSSTSTGTSSFTSWMQVHPLVAYFSIAYAGTWILELPMVLGKDGLGLFSFSVPFMIYVILFLMSSFAGPTLAAFLVTNALDGKEGMLKLFRRYGQWRVGAVWYILAILGFPVIYVTTASILMHGLPLANFRANWVTFFSTYLPALLIFPAFITWGEEPGWRGFALTRLQERYNPLVSSLILGFMHGLWHLPVFLLVSGPPAIGPFNLTKFVMNIGTIMILTIIWTWIFNHAKGSILIAVLLHASLNAAQGWLGGFIPNYPADTGKWTILFFILVALVLMIVTKTRLGYPSDPQIQTTDSIP